MKPNCFCQVIFNLVKKLSNVCLVLKISTYKVITNGNKRNYEQWQFRCKVLQL